jgi:LCP family protein required for cell wall assembly
MREVGVLRQLKKPKKAVIITASAAVIIAVFAVSAAAFLNWRPLKEGSAAKTSGSESLSREPNEQLLWNSDFSDFLVCGIDDTSFLTDVIMLVSLDNTNKKISILQIPRDTYVDKNVPTHKYNAIYNHHEENQSGMDALKAQVETDFGVKISNYAAVTTKGFRNVVDSVGGVEVDVPIDMNYDDDAQNLHIHLKKGKQCLNGEAAEGFVRYRKGWSMGDVGRLSAQQIFLAAFTKKLQTLSFSELSTKVLPVLKEPEVKTDFSVYEILELYNSHKDISLQNSKVFTMPGEYFTSDSGLSLYSVHKDELLKILNSNFVPSGVTLTSDEIGIKQVSDKEKSSASSNNLSDILN